VKTYYGILGVTKKAALKEIKTAYRRLALKYHPDVNKSKSAAQKFGEISTAYKVLSDASERKAYDKSFRRPKKKKRRFKTLWAVSAVLFFLTLACISYSAFFALKRFKADDFLKDFKRQHINLTEKSFLSKYNEADLQRRAKEAFALIDALPLPRKMKLELNRELKKIRRAQEKSDEQILNIFKQANQ